MARRSCSVALNGKLRTMRRLAWLGAATAGALPLVSAVGVAADTSLLARLLDFEVLGMVVGLERVSRRFLRVTERRAPL